MMQFDVKLKYTNRCEIYRKWSNRCGSYFIWKNVHSENAVGERLHTKVTTEKQERYNEREQRSGNKRVMVVR